MTDHPTTDDDLPTLTTCARCSCMKPRDGYDLCVECAKDGIALPVVTLTGHPTTDDPSIVERIWSVLDAHGMGVMRKDDLDALNGRVIELGAENVVLRNNVDSLLAAIDPEVLDWIDALEANIGNHCTVMSVSAQADLVAVFRRLAAALDAIKEATDG